ncbi:hypothetical protein [Acinetobacter nosocomialis]|uniref:hypothetical protein n=1 Tax=Acinetobacter nosocomialis TaxID=106654 RepID=UPI00125E005E|nr:hypothetical protein [Acinetobacter nosocomialis]
MRAFGIIPYELISESVDNFPAGRTTGISIAAIKCLLVLGLACDFYTKEVSLSLSELEERTGCSKPMVVMGIKYLISIGVIAKVHQNKTNIKGRYLINFPSTKFTQVPYPLTSLLRSFPNKGITVLVALKAYLVILKFRWNNTAHAEVSYMGFSRYGINTKHLSKALAILISSDYIAISKTYNRDETGYNKSCNNYQIKHLYKAVPAPNGRPYLDLVSFKDKSPT